MENKMHIAKSGKQAGQWVSCTAKNCRNGGTHTSLVSLKETKTFVGKKSIASLTQEDYISYLRDKLSPKPLTRVEKYQLKLEDDNKNDDLRDQAYAKETGLDGKVEQTITITLNKAQWMDFLGETHKQGIEIPFSAIQQYGQEFRTNRTVELKNLKIRGKAEALENILKTI